MRLLIIAATVAALIFGSVGVASADGRRQTCDPLSYGLPRSCHTAPVIRSATHVESYAPFYGSRFTARHGWIVWADNDRWFPIRTRCHWFAFGTYWHTSWRIRPGGYVWTTSDAGQWGNQRPTGLRCSYVRTY